MSWFGLLAPLVEQQVKTYLPFGAHNFVSQSSGVNTVAEEADQLDCTLLVEKNSLKKVVTNIESLSS